MQKADWKFWLAVSLAAYFFYKWNEAAFCQTLALPLMVAGYEAKSGKQAPAAARDVATVIEGRYYNGTNGGELIGAVETAPAKKDCSCQH